MDEKPGREDLLKTPIRMLDLSGIGSISDLVEGFSHTSFQARNLSTAVEIMQKMIEPEGDGASTVFLGLSGSLIAAGLRKVIADLIRLRLVDVIATTGAVVYQDFYQAMGYRHYKGSVGADDVLLHERMIDRIYDTYVDEEKFRETDLDIGEIMEGVGPGRYSTREFMAILGERCSHDGDSILGNAFKEGVPIYCPAIADSSIGIGLSTAYRRMAESGGEMLVLDTIRDNYEMAQIVNMSRATSAIYLGGGVPKNYINDSIVTADMIYGGINGHEYAFQVTMDRAEWGGLSGSTLGEAQSWGKIDAEATHVMVHVEMSISLPLIAGAVMERRGYSKRRGPIFVWEGDKLLTMKGG